MLTTLTDSALKALKAPKRGRNELTDLRSPGLAFRITDKEARSFSFRFRCPTSGRVNRLTLGKYPDLTLAQARTKADDLRGQVANGMNPADEARRAKATAASRSFGAVAERYLDEHAKRHKAASSAKEDDRNLKLHILPKWKNRHIATLRRSDGIEIIEGLITDGKHVLANRVGALISKIFNFGVDADLINANPFARMKKRGTETPGKRVLTDGEIKQFWPRVMLAPLSRRSGLALRLMLLTAARPGEVAGVRRDELTDLDDTKKALWRIPGERTKNGKPHAIPLTAEARDTIKAALELVDEKEAYVFPSPKKEGEPMRPHSLTVGMKRLAGKIEGAAGKTWKASPPTPHDLRRTVATRLSELGTPMEDISALLNHVRRDVTGKHYDQYTRLAEKRRALTAWAASLSALGISAR
jgi:integrase